MSKTSMNNAIDRWVEVNLGVAFPAAQVVVLVNGEVVHQRAYGYLDPDARTQPTRDDTRFDLASVSKLFAVAAFMSLVEQGRVGLDQPVRDVLPQFDGERPIAPYPDPLHPGGFIEVVPANARKVDAARVTFRSLLAHNSGLPAWLPIWKMEVPAGAETLGAAMIARRRDEVARTPFAYPIGERVVYSDIGLMLVGFAIEALTGQTLREAVRERVTAPLGLDSVAYSSIGCANVAPTEYYAHQGRRMCGEVHDENAWSLGGASGHAGLFASARDMAAFGEALRANTLLRRETMLEMTRLQAQNGLVRRGLGFALWSVSNESAANPLSPLTYGHTGFTGTSLYVDPAREAVVACATNRVYFGRAGEDFTTPFRVGLHRLIAESLPASERR